eukprot:GCRY01002790.1.p1 GENE.GCRY01002790.1~~GCRY01002790.1.p1  ORF type:complete len:562 (-),score=164.23 GCRY01002790.1:42-1727(-)
MSENLSLLKIRAQNQAREDEEKKKEERKKAVIVLLLSHLFDSGYFSSVEHVQTETGVSLNRYEVADNVNLLQIVQEYEEYYEFKFGKKPKLFRKQSSQAQKAPPHRSTTPSSQPLRRPSASRESPRFSLKQPLPDIQNPPHTRPPLGADRGRAGKDAGSAGVGPDRKSVLAYSHHGHGARKEPKSDSPAGVAHSPAATGDSTAADALEIGGANVVRKELTPATRHAKLGLSQPEDESGVADSFRERVIKPLPPEYAHNAELREFAQTITRDIFMRNLNVSWSEIAGLAEAKKILKEAVVMPIKYPQLFSGLLAPWKGLLLYGPPGTGKTLLAKAVATQCKTTFFNISASTIISKWRGDSEKLIRVLFDLARHYSPSTIFLDEIDALMGERGQGGATEHEGSRRMKTELLIQMDGLAKTDDLVFLLAATNIPWDLDTAFLRRLEKRIYVKLPNVHARKEMLKHHLAALSVPDLDFDKFAVETEGWSGDDIRLLCKEAAMVGLRKLMRKLELLEEDESAIPDEEIKPLPITNEDVCEALTVTTPSTKSSLEQFQHWERSFGSS